jgi:hypothetical protein
MYPKYQGRINELNVKNLGCSTGLLPWVANDSPSRIVMVGGHLSQMLVIEGATPRRHKTGVEASYADATWKVVMPCHARILKIIHKFPTNRLGKNNFKANSETLLVYENLDARDEGRQELGVLTLTTHHSKHQTFGFKYRQVESSKGLIAENEIVPKGTVFCQSPNVDKTGDWKFGIEANVAFMSIPEIIEDGYVVSKSFCEKLATTSIKTYSFSFGKNEYPLNTYARPDDPTYRPFPEIGEKIRPDGILFASRKYDPLLAGIEMTPEALRDIDVVFDRPIFVPPGAEVIDIKVMHDPTQPAPPTPMGMEELVNKYYDAQQTQASELVRFYREFKRKNPNVQLTPELHNLIVRSLAINPAESSNKVSMTYRASPLDDWTVEVTIAQRIIPLECFKITDLHGGKGVIVAVWDDSDMPVDQWGNRADIIMDGDSTIKRMNIGRLYEQYSNGANREVANKTKAMFTGNNYTECFNYLMSYYYIASPYMHQLMTSRYVGKDKEIKLHVDYVLQNGIELWLPPDSPHIGAPHIRAIKEHFPVPRGPVQYRGSSGKLVTTKDSILIASIYIILLEKTGSEWAAVSSARRQHFGILAKLTNADKYNLPWRDQPVRLTGEAEFRAFVANVGPEAAIDIMELANSPVAQDYIGRNLLTHPTPTNIKDIAPEQFVPRGANRSVQYVTHIVGSGGAEFTRD